MAGRNKAWLALALVALLAGCTTPAHPPLNDAPRLKIDHSVQAVSHSSRVSVVVLHYTATHTERALELLAKRNVSSHYLITDDEPPHVYQLVDESRRAWHAGESSWYERSDLNAASIGVEIVNLGPLEGGEWQPYSESQIQALIALLKDVVSRHQIHARNIVGHSDIAPQRKQDPGPVFPWQRLAEADLGRWYDTELAARLETQYRRQGLPPMAVVQEKLRHAGYPTPYSGKLDAATRKVLRAFQMHYRPAKYDGSPDAETLAILDALP